MASPSSTSSIAQAVMAKLEEAAELLGSVDAHADDLDRDRRADRVRPFRDAVTDADFARIVSGSLESDAWSEVRLFICSVCSASPWRFLWLTGAPGTGKTVAALGAVAELGGRYMTAETIRRGFCQETDEARQIRSDATHCRLLVIDDFGVGRDLEQMRFALQEIVNVRQSGRRLTIITSNLSRDDVFRSCNARTMDRMRKPRGKLIEIKGKTMRGGDQ